MVYPATVDSREDGALTTEPRQEQEQDDFLQRSIGIMIGGRNGVKGLVQSGGHCQRSTIMALDRWILAASLWVLASGPASAGEDAKVKAKPKEAPNSPSAVSFDTKRVAIGQNTTIEIIDVGSGRTLCKMVG